MHRREDVCFKLKLNHKFAEKYRERLENLKLIGHSPTAKGDILNIDYKLFIEYFGNVVENLELFVELADAGVIITGDLENVRSGQVLIKRVLESLYKIRNKIK